MLQRYRMITIEVNARDVLDTLNRMVQGLGDATPVMADLANVLASESKHQFASQSGPLGPWPRWAMRPGLSRCARCCCRRRA